jgi:hypothetical protein
LAAVDPALGEPADAVDDGLLLHAAASKAVAMADVTATIRAGDCRFMAASVPADGGESITRGG